MSKIKETFFGKGCAAALAVFSVILTVVPEEFFKCGIISCEWSESTILMINRLIVFLIIYMIANITYYCYRIFRKSVTIDGDTYKIRISYGDICNISKGKKVINFDECFTTTVGIRPEDVKPDSVCGQYLTKYPMDDIQNLLNDTGIRSRSNSLYKNKSSYTPGILVPRGDFLLMAFAKLDGKGRGNLRYDEYLAALNKLWEQVDCYHGTDDVYVPILGSRITRFDKDLTQQELLDIMVASFRLNPYKLKRPNTLHIVCKEREGFSLNDIFGVD